MPGSFVGRDDQLRALRDACRRAATSGAPEAVVVVGDPGSGKSRLLAELRNLADIGETILIAGYEPEQSVPYAAARDLLHRLGTGLHDQRELLSPGSGPERHLTEQLRLFEAAHAALGSSGAAVIIIDDLHWADEASTSLIHYLVRAAELGREPLTVVAASRPSSPALGLIRSLRRVLGGERVTVVDLVPLSVGAGALLIGELAPHLDPDQQAEIWRNSAGSPFWLELLATSDRFDVDVDREISGRLRAVSADAEEALVLLAVVARPLAVEDVAGIAVWEIVRVDQAVSGLIGAGLAASRGRSLTVAHELIRRAVIRTIGDGRARTIHRRYGVWLESHSGGDEPRLLEALEHQQLGGLPVVGLAARLGGSSRRRLLGVGGLERLAEVADDSDPSDVDAVALRRHVASLAAELGEYDEALQRWSEYSLLRGDHPADAALSAVRASEAAVRLARPAEAWRQWGRARSCDYDDAVISVEILAQEAAIGLAFERVSERTRTAASASVIAARSLVGAAGGVDALDPAARHALLRALSVAMDAARLDADPELMLALAEQLSAAAAGVDVTVHIRASLDGAMALRFRGQNLDALGRLRRAWSEARRCALPPATLEVGVVLGLVLLSVGEIDAARTVERECSSLGIRLSEFHPSRSFLLLLPHMIELTAGDWRSAVEQLGIAAAAEPDPHYRQHAHKERAVALARLEPERSLEQVREEVSAALADSESAGCRRCRGETTARGAEALARVGDASRARSLLDNAEIPDADAHNWFWLQWAESVLLMVTADPRAGASLAAVVAEAARQSLNLEALRARLDLGATLARDGSAGAVDLLHAAGAAAEQLGAITEQRVAEKLLRALGVRTWRRAPTRPGVGRLSALTDREREIALLVADGASNPEIAAALFVSRKTVERHVSNLLAKLGTRNRAELAVLVTESLGDIPDA